MNVVTISKIIIFIFYYFMLELRYLYIIVENVLNILGDIQQYKEYRDLRYI